MAGSESVWVAIFVVAAAGVYGFAWYYVNYARQNRKFKSQDNEFCEQKKEIDYYNEILKRIDPRHPRA